MRLVDGLKVLGSLVFTVILFVVPVHAVAVPVMCTFGDELYPDGTAADLTTSTDCEVHLGINDTEANVATVDPFGITDWVRADKIAGGDGDGVLDLSGVVVDVNSGTWSIADFKGYTSIFLTLKASDGFAAYLLDTAFSSGEWTTADLFPSGDGGKDLSHMSLYYSPGSVTVVPLPAAFPLYGAGLALLGLVAHRRRSKSA